MSASPAVRSVRAVVFAAVCVLLAAAGHGLAMGDMPSLWADGAGFLGVFAAGWLLGGKERSLPGIGATMLATQACLHVAFDAARPRTAHAGGRGSFPAMPSMPFMPSTASMPTSAHGPDSAAANGTHTVFAHAHALPLPAMPTHELSRHAVAAHVLAALVASWWLRRGEAALWSLLRRAVAGVPRLASWWRGVHAPLPAPAVRDCRAFAVASPPSSLRLRHAVIRRGPPAGIPYPV
ncbi:hypothetical protein [Streptomyces spiralis]|uniref:hypothetical protein n=1 Tax=Streptomyces spiralis TaxID=66376 RepID=UPI003698EE42